MCRRAAGQVLRDRRGKISAGAAFSGHPYRYGSSEALHVWYGRPALCRTAAYYALAWRV